MTTAPASSASPPLASPSSPASPPTTLSSVRISSTNDGSSMTTPGLSTSASTDGRTPRLVPTSASTTFLSSEEASSFLSATSVTIWMSVTSLIVVTNSVTCSVCVTISVTRLVVGCGLVVVVVVDVVVDDGVGRPTCGWMCKGAFLYGMYVRRCSNGIDHVFHTCSREEIIEGEIRHRFTTTPSNRTKS